MIVEIFDRRAVRRARIRLTAFPASVGRGYGNDIILDDRYVDPAHARIEWDGAGGLVVVDLGSRNGVVDPETGARVPRLALRSGTSVRLGYTTLRFVDPSEPVAPAAAVGAGPERLLIGDSVLRAALVIAGSGALFALNNYLGSVGETRLTELLSEALGGLLAVAVWAGLWALVSRVTRHQFRFLGHLAVATGTVSAILVFTAAGEYLEFFFPRLDGELVPAVFGLGAAATALAAHLARASHLDRLRRWLWAGGITAVCVGLALLSSAGEDREEDDGRTEIKPVPLHLIPTVSAESFLTRVDRLQAKVDSLALEEPEEEEGKGKEAAPAEEPDPPAE